MWERLIRVLARSGRRAEALLLSADVEQPAVAREQLPRKLPFDVASFTGRDAEIAELDRFLDTRRGRPPPSP